MSSPGRHPSAAPSCEGRVTTLAAAVVFAISATALAGWTLHVPALRSVLFGGTPINPVSALSFWCVALGLFASTRPAARWSQVRVIAGVVLALTASTRLAGYVGLPTIALDGMLFAAELGTNRMAPNLAAAFVLLGAALTMLDRFRVPATALVFAAAALGWLAMLGYLYNVLSLYGVPRGVPMAFASALALLFSCGGLASARPSREPIAILVDRGTGGALTRRLLPFALIAPTLIGWVRLEAQRRNLFSAETGVSMMVLLTSASMFLGVYFSARLLRAMDGEQAKIRELIRDSSLTDELTGLRNRRGFLELARQQMLVSRRLQQPMLLFFVDLDGLKQINDVHGHDAGDRAIRDFAAILRAAFRESDLLARLGGDEFLALALNASQSPPIEERLADALRQYSARPSAPFRLAASIGVTVCDPASPEDIDTVIREADAKMYAQKMARRAGRDERAHPQPDTRDAGPNPEP